MTVMVGAEPMSPVMSLVLAVIPALARIAKLAALPRSTVVGPTAFAAGPTIVPIARINAIPTIRMSGLDL